MTTERPRGKTSSWASRTSHFYKRRWLIETGFSDLNRINRRWKSNYDSIRYLDMLGRMLLYNSWKINKKLIQTRNKKKGYIVQMHMDTNWTDRLHYFLELPKGKLYLHMDERTDILKAKEILGGHICVEGNLKPSLFTVGTPNMIEKQVKKIIDELYKRFREKIGPGVDVTIKEVKEIPKDKNINFVRIVISKLKKP